MTYDAIIIGGGPAGLSAALVLGRCRRRVLVCDAGEPRNATSGGVHGFLTRDGILPSDLLRIGREQLEPYGVEILPASVRAIEHEGAGFKVILNDGTGLACRKVLLATGLRDKVPAIEGIEPMFGKSVHHCPYCDGWEWRDQAIAAYGRRQTAFGMALLLRMVWSDDVVLLTNGPAGLNRQQRDELSLWNIPVREERIERLEGTNGKLERIVFRNGAALERRALFLNTGFRQQCDLAKDLGCLFNRKGVVRAGRHEETNVPGIYVAGDASRDVQMVIIAAAEGVKAAKAINEVLQDEDRAKRKSSSI